MDISGERFIPEEHDIIIALEHWHRYLHILDIVKNKKVIDIASGTGYGTNLLASNAKNITGIDISEKAVLNSKKEYVQDNLNYLIGSVENIPFDDNTIDVVVSFETIEHISEELQVKFLKEVKRVLKDDGIFIVSTPEKHHYSDIRNYSNEFHIKEFYEKEFQDFLNNYFSNINFNYQTTLIGSNIFNKVNAKLDKKYLFNDSSKNISKEYVIAYCSNQDNLSVPKPSINIDYENVFFHNLNTQTSELWKRVNQTEAQLEDSSKTNEELWKRVNQTEAQLEEINNMSFLHYIKRYFKND